MLLRYCIFLCFSVVLIVTIAVGCKKNVDTVSPVITVILPASQTIYENGDTIKFKALFSDETQLKSVSVQLVDKDNKPALASVSSNLVTNPYTFAGGYIIDDPLLPGAVYNLRFQASDGVNITNRFIEIQVHELPRKLLYPLIVTHPKADSWQTYSLPESGGWKELTSHTGDYCGSAVNPASSLFYFCGKYLSGLAAAKLPGGNAAWLVKPGFNSSQRWFEGISFNSPLLYVACYEGNIRGYDKSGNEIYKSETFLNSYPYLSVCTKNLILASYKDDFSANRNLVAFHNQGGKMIYTKFIQKDVIGMINTTSDNVLVFSNVNGHGDISLWSGIDNSFVPMRTLPEGQFHEAIKMDNDNYFISTSVGLYRYELSTNALSQFISKTINSEISYDPLALQIYTCTGKMLEIYSIQSAALVGSYPLPDTAVDLHLVFNK